jgi:hypothetical protein
MTRYFDESVVSSLITAKYRVITSNRVLFRRSLHQSIVSSHQTECCVVPHYIKVSCHPIKQSVVSSLITSKYVVITSNSVVSSLITAKHRVITSNRVLCRRSLDQSIVSSHQTECCVVAHYIKVSCHPIKQCVVSSPITSKYRVITSNRVLCRRSLHQSIVSWRHNTLFDVMTRYFDVMSDDTILSLVWWHDTLM